MNFRGKIRGVRNDALETDFRENKIPGGAKINSLSADLHFRIHKKSKSTIRLSHFARLRIFITGNSGGIENVAVGQAIIALVDNNTAFLALFRGHSAKARLIPLYRLSG